MKDNIMFHVIQAGVQTSGDWQARVHSIFANAVNILTEHKRFTLLFNPLWISENNLILDDHDILQFIEPSSLISSQSGYLSINRQPIAQYKTDLLWQMPIIARTIIAPENLAKLQHFLMVNQSTGIVVYIENLFIATITQFMVNQQADFSKIIGAGIGLTPSGDDMLVGFALALYSEQPDLLPILHQSCTPYLNATTDISRYLLEDALVGRFSAPLVNLVQKLKYGQDIDNAIQVAANIGSSSGRDGLFGFYQGLKAVNGY